MEAPMHRRFPRSAQLLLVLALGLLPLGSCVMGGQMSKPTGASSVIGRDEIDESSATNAYDLVYQVRPLWLRGRGSPNLRGGAPVLPVVYVGHVRQGSVETLRSFGTNGLLELRYLDATTATTRYGDGHSGGVIEVDVRRR
jgi:hypothetical protein